MALRILAVSVASICLMCQSAVARTWSDGQSLSYVSGLQTMRYRLYLPANYTASKNYPLVLFMHGSGESGTNNSSQVSNHISNLINLTESQYPSILIAPQLPTASGWSPGNSVDLTSGILQRVLDNYAVDDNRLYLTGLSMGGFGSMNYLDWYTDGVGIEFAAAVSLSGGYSTTVNSQAVDNFNDVPIWLIHGNNDSVVSVNYSRNTYRSLIGISAATPINFNQTIMGYPTAVNGDIRYSEIPGGGHSGWSSLYGQTTIYNWMFAQSVPEPPANVLSLTALVGSLRLRKRRTV